MLVYQCYLMGISVIGWTDAIKPSDPTGPATRLSRTGNRQLNATLRRMTQAGCHQPADLMARRRNAGNGDIKALRVLKDAYPTSSTKPYAPTAHPGLGTGTMYSLSTRSTAKRPSPPQGIAPAVLHLGATRPRIPSPDQGGPVDAEPRARTTATDPRARATIRTARRCNPVEATKAGQSHHG